MDTLLLLEKMAQYRNSLLRANQKNDLTKGKLRALSQIQAWLVEEVVSQTDRAVHRTKTETGGDD